MRIIQVNDEEKTNEQYSQNIIRKLRNSLTYNSHEQLSDSQLTSDQSANLQINIDNTIQNAHYLKEYDNEILNDENIVDETQIDSVYIDQLNTLNLEKESSIENDHQIENNKFVTRKKEMKKTNTSTINVDEGEINDVPEHHDSDTESFYNIWNDDEDWLYGNKQRNVVRNIHR